MEYRQLGRSGVRVSVIGLGTNRFGTKTLPQEQVDRIIDAAQDLGINFIDTANTYTNGHSEQTLGKALKRRWDRFVLATKVSMSIGDGPNDVGASRYHIMNAVDLSLSRLQTDHIDLYYIHRWDHTTPIEETLRALDDLVRMGKVCYVGASAFASWQLASANLMADMRGWPRFVVIQSHYNIFEREVEGEVLPYCRAHNVGFIPYYPLAGGFLTGKYKRGKPAPVGSRGETNKRVQQYLNDSYYDKIERLEKWAGDHGRGLNELAQAWLMAQPQVCSVISGSTKIEHVLSNAKAADWEMKAEDLQELNDILEVDDVKKNST